MASLYKDLVRAGIPTDHHESDLYVLATPQARELVKKYGYSAKTFKSNIDGQWWLDIPFAYEPFWEKKQQAQRGSPKGERTLEAATGPNVPYEWPKKARKGAPKSSKRAHATKKSGVPKTGLPVRGDVTELEYHRPPTASEIRFGHGATHYRTFPVEEAVVPGTRIPKKWLVASDDGLRYYR